MGHCIVVVFDELFELGFQIGHRSEVPLSDQLAVNDSKEDFDLIQPRTMFGQVNKSNSMGWI